MKKENPVHVLINSHIDVRKHVLLCGIDAIKALEKYEYFKRLKNLKKRKFQELNTKLNELNQDVTSLYNLFPELREKQIEKDVRKIENREELMPRADKTVNKVRGFEREIRNIQEKLNRLNF